ncbi:hypothetical protein SAMN02745146_0836 [Hymenobacter daecheongensis DSM 21074]|uniref:RNA polymerase sigma factor, sigma-70 family n=1 Tax=Hymenobacter daecheongensis DSM 21074 TaxID=1121955 RepID=A0A1M6B0Y3_9BACT|nr:hypothetical protein [Hymenobacter daecheongensis]SHI42399.1 hypothetical protein SAMN02745146_0836 [Hymenobacter daecheongensis DSM 21074]
MPTTANQPLAEILTQMRVGNQSFLIKFYQDRRDHFARWARRQHQLEPAAAHELLRTVLVDFYDQVADGRLTKMPADMRAHLYGMGQERMEAASRVSTGTEELPVVEASRRQRMLRLFRQLGSDSQLLLMYFYFKAFSFDKVAGKMGYANANVARLQKANCLRKLYEIMSRDQNSADDGAGAAALAT